MIRYFAKCFRKWGKSIGDFGRQPLQGQDQLPDLLRPAGKLPGLMESGQCAGQQNQHGAKSLSKKVHPSLAARLKLQRPVLLVEDPAA